MQAHDLNTLTEWCKLLQPFIGVQTFQDADIAPIFDNYPTTILAGLTASEKLPIIGLNKSQVEALLNYIKGLNVFLQHSRTDASYPISDTNATNLATKLGFSLTNKSISDLENEIALRLLSARPAPRRPQTYGIPLYNEAFDVVADWTPVAACTVAADTVNYTAGYTNFQSLKLTADGTATTCTARKTFGVAKNFTDATHNASGYAKLLGRVFIHPTDGSHVVYVKIRLETTASDYWEYTIYRSTMASQGGLGWQQASFGLRGVAGTGGSFNPASVASVLLIVGTDSATATPSVSFDLLRVYKSPTKVAQMPSWIITMDDQYAGAYNALAYLTANGIPGTMYCSTSRVGNAGRMTWAQLRLMRMAGHLIGNHTYGHSNLTSLTTAAAQLEVAKGANDLIVNGCGDGAGFFASPGGFWNPTLNDAIMGRFADHHRGTYYGMNGVTTTGIAHDTLGLSQTDRSCIGTAIASRVTLCRADGAVMCDLFHSFDDSQTVDSISVCTLAEFKTYVDGLVSARDAETIKCVTPADLVHRAGA